MALLKNSWGFAGEAHLDFLPNLADFVTSKAERLKELDRGFVGERNLAGQPLRGYRKGTMRRFDLARSSCCCTAIYDDGAFCLSRWCGIGCDEGDHHL